jgi:uncharacterized protein YoxC
MTGAALSVAIAAIAITLFGVILQWLAYRATIEQAQKAAQNVAEMRTEIHGLVGELRGMTERMVEAQERQFNRMLEAFVTKPGAAAEVAERTGESAEALQQISDAMEALKEEVRHAASADEVQHKLDELAGRLEAVSAVTARAARLAQGAARQGGALRTAHLSTGGVEVRVAPAVIPRGGRVIMDALMGLPLRDIYSAECVVRAPNKQTWSQWWRQDQSDPPRSPRFVFPDDFADASTRQIGRYNAEITVFTDWGHERLTGAFFDVSHVEES